MNPPSVGYNAVASPDIQAAVLPGSEAAGLHMEAGFSQPVLMFGQLIPGFSHPVPLAAVHDIEAYAARQIVSYPGTPSPMYAAVVGAPLELFSFKYGNPYSPVNNYDEMRSGRVNDPYAYLNIQWQAPLETFAGASSGPLHASYEDATAGSNLIASQNLSAPTQAYNNQAGYGLP